jgi:hypothetical protein
MGYSFIRTDLNVDAGSMVPCCQFATPPCPMMDSWCALPPGDYPVYPEDTASDSRANHTETVALLILLIVALLQL